MHQQISFVIFIMSLGFPVYKLCRLVYPGCICAVSEPHRRTSESQKSVSYLYHSIISPQTQRYRWWGAFGLLLVKLWCKNSTTEEIICPFLGLFFARKTTKWISIKTLWKTGPFAKRRAHCMNAKWKHLVANDGRFSPKFSHVNEGKTHRNQGKTVWYVMEPNKNLNLVFPWG